MHNHGDPPDIFDPLGLAFQVRSRSLELTRIDRQPDLPISDPYNHGQLSYRFRDKQGFRSKIAKCFLPLVYLTASLKEFLLEYCIGKSLTICVFV